MTQDELPPIDDELRALLDAERAIPEPPSAVSRRLAARVAASVGAPLLLSDAPTVDASSAVGASVHAAQGAGALTLAKLAPLALAFVIGGGAGAAITISVIETRAPVSAPAPEPKPQLPIAPQPAPVLEPAGPGMEPPHEVVAPVEERALRDAGPRVVSERDTLDRDLGAERHLIELARAALARTRAEDALAALDKHARRFPKGRLAEERDSLRVPVLVLLGRGDDAKAAAARFEARYPNSLFAPVVRGATQTLP